MLFFFVVGFMVFKYVFNFLELVWLMLIGIGFGVFIFFKGILIVLLILDCLLFFFNVVFGEDFLLEFDFIFFVKIILFVFEVWCFFLLDSEFEFFEDLDLDFLLLVIKVGGIVIDGGFWGNIFLVLFLDVVWFCCFEMGLSFNVFVELLILLVFFVEFMFLLEDIREFRIWFIFLFLLVFIFLFMFVILIGFIFVIFLDEEIDLDFVVLLFFMECIFFLDVVCFVDFLLMGGFGGIIVLVEIVVDLWILVFSFGFLVLFWVVCFLDFFKSKFL